MTFRVKYRAGDGKMREECIEAANRADCIAKCKAWGIVPTSVREGNIKVKNGGAISTHKMLNFKIVSASALLIVVGAVLLLNINRPVSHQKTESAKRSKTQEHIQKTTRPKHGKVEKEDAVTSTSAPEVKKASIQSTNAVPDEKRANDEALRKKWKEKFARHRSIFSNASDQILGMIVNTPPGRDMPPMPITKGIDRDFMKSLETPIEINENDSDEIKAVKQAVMELRAEVLAIKESQNLTVYEILTQHQDLMRENAKIRAEVQKEAVELYRSGDVEGTREFVDKVNTKLDGLGAERIKMPGTQNPELRQRLRDSLNKLKNRKNPKRN
jgi:hypothetical protein